MSHFSCDDEVDAIRSLARIYRVDVGLVDEVAKGHWPSFILDSADSYHDQFDSRYTPSLMARHLSAKPVWEIGEVAYYHRTVYDGSVDWFKDGLLPAPEGPEVLLEKIDKWFVLDDKLRQLALAKIKHRNNLEGVGSGGPYAFDILDVAKNANRSGLDYSLPEFLGECLNEVSLPFSYVAELLSVLQRKLKPVVVKFSASPCDADQYINNLWHYLFLKHNGEEWGDAYHYTFFGGGKSVSATRIIQLIDLDEGFGGANE